MTRSEILSAAKAKVCVERQAEYGDATEMHERIAQAWSAVLGDTVTSYQVALCMVALKICRATQAQDPDSLIDAAGYAALAAEMTPSPTQQLKG